MGDKQARKSYTQQEQAKQRERQRDEIQQQPRKGREPMKPYARSAQGKVSAVEESYEAQLDLERKRTERYRDAWESEKLINQANMEHMRGLQRRLRKANGRAFARGTAFGIGVALAALGLLGMILKYS